MLLISHSLVHILFIFPWVNFVTLRRLEGSPIVRETGVQFHVESHQRLKKWYLMPPCLTLSMIRYGSRVKWSNPGNGVAPSPTPRCSSSWKGSLRVPSTKDAYFTFTAFKDLIPRNLIRHCQTNLTSQILSFFFLLSYALEIFALL